MTIEIKVPVLPESVADATVSAWHKKAGDAVTRDENLVDLETDKVVLEVPAPADGILEKIVIAEGETVTTGTVIGIIRPGSAATVPPQPAVGASGETHSIAVNVGGEAGPAARRAAAEMGIDVKQVAGTGKDGRVTKEDVKQQSNKAPVAAATPLSAVKGGREEKRVPMTRLRQTIANRLLAAKQETAMLTTFNEVNLQAVSDLRNKYKEQFEKEHQTKLGFMSFFTKAAVEALKRFPDVNASIDGNDIVYHGYYDISIAVSSPRGLVVPVIRNVDQLDLAGIEKAVKEYADKARNGTISLDEMTGGTFTITNGGVFGSMLSTPILNPPQSAILGMHSIQQRPIVENGEIVIRPMMYLALSYDHRIIDGQQSVLFLRTIKELLEDPARFLLNI